MNERSVIFSEETGGGRERVTTDEERVQRLPSHLAVLTKTIIVLYN